MNNLLSDGAMVVTPQKQTMAAGSELEVKRGATQIDPKKEHPNSHTLSYFGLPYQDHNYGAPPPPTPPQSPPHCPEVEPVAAVEVATVILPEEPKKEVESSEDEREEEEEDEVEGSKKDEGVTRCICDFEHDDGYMICCDKCLVWQHVECMGLDRSNIPDDNYFCEKCEPRMVDVENAKALQSKKKKHLEELQKREEDEKKLGKGEDSVNSLKPKKKLKKKKKKKEKDRDREDDSKGDKKKDKKKKKKDRERGDSLSYDNLSDESLRMECESAVDDTETLKEASLIQCTPEVENMMQEHRKNPEMFLAGAATYHGPPEEMKRMKVCVGQVGRGETNGVVTLEQIPANQPIMQLSGMLALRDNKRKTNPNQLESFMFVYSSFCNTELILNAGSHDNIARFTRKSCSPNAEIRHMIFDGVVHLYLFALKDISINSEVTLGLDYDFTLGSHPVKCACGKKNCPVRKFWHKQKSNGIKHKNSSVEDKLNSPAKRILSPLKLTLSKQISQESPKKDEVTPDKQSPQSRSEPATPKCKVEETESAAAKPVHKMTREERKMDAIMKAFEKLEKSQQRRQQTLERLAQNKERRTSGDTENEPKGSGEKVENTNEECDDGAKEDNVAAEVKEEIADESKDVNVTEQEEIQELIPQLDWTLKTRTTMKRKKGSRRRTRNSSGAFCSPVEGSSADDEPNHTPISRSLSSSDSQPPCPTASDTPSSSSLLSVQTGFSNPSETSMDAVSLASPAANSKHFKFPKTKRFFMNEWLNEKAQEASADSPLTVKTEDFDQVVPAINSPSAAASKERSTSLDASFGSAKKRWLRQAMQETIQTGSNSGSNSPICNGGASPVMATGASPAVSPNSNSMDFMTPLKKRMLRHSLAEERPSQRLSPKSETPFLSESIQIPDQTSVEEPLLSVKVKTDDECVEEPLPKTPNTTPSFHLPLPARKTVRKNSSIDSGLSVTTPADLDRSPSFPALNDNQNIDSTTARKLDLGSEECEKTTRDESIATADMEPAPSKDLPSITEPSSLSVPEEAKFVSPMDVTKVQTLEKKKQDESPVDAQTVVVAPVISQQLKRCLSDEATFSNGEINPAYYSPKKRHLYLRQNTDPGMSERPLGGTWPRQDFTKSGAMSLTKVNEEVSTAGPLSQSWSGSPEKSASYCQDVTPVVPAPNGPGLTLPKDVQPPVIVMCGPSVAPIASLDVPPHLPPGVVASPIPGAVPLGPRISHMPPCGPPSQMGLSPEQRFLATHPRCQSLELKPDGIPYPSHPIPEDGHPPPLIMEDPKYLSPNPGGSVSAPTTPSKKKVSLLEYRKRKGVSITKTSPEKAEEESEEAEVMPKPETTPSVPNTSTESTPEKTNKPPNVITFKDKKFQDVTSTVTKDGLQSLPLFSKAPITESPEGKKLSLTDEAHKLITSLTQVLMEGKPGTEKPDHKTVDPAFVNEDPLQRMRRELNEKNMEKVLALKRAHSPEPPPPPPEKKSRLEASSPPVPPPPPPRNIPAFVPGIHSPKAGGLQRPVNQLVVNTPPVIGVQQTNGGHVVYPQVIHGIGIPQAPPSTPSVVPPYQQPVGKHQVHSPRGHYSPIAASTSPRGSLAGHPPPPNPNNFQYQHNNHVEDPPLMPNQIGQYQNFNGDQGGFHVNGDVPPHQLHGKNMNLHHTSRKVTEGARPPGSPYSSSKYSSALVHDKRSQSSYGRNSRALSPRRSYHRH